jgi:hypothetical protein
MQSQTDLLNIFLYLIDWKNNINARQSITNIKWSVYENGIPYPLNLKKVNSHINDSDDVLFSHFNEMEALSIRHVINFIEDNHTTYIYHIVLSTYPCLLGTPHKEIDLSQCVERYQSIISQRTPV